MNTEGNTPLQGPGEQLEHADAGRYTCARCNVPLEPVQTQFSYLKHPFHADILRCPQCGMAMIDEALVKGRMAEVETTLEDK